MPLSHQGGCLCGAVRFEIQGVFQHFFLCHCSYCRKDTGSAHAANLFAPGAKLNWLSGHTEVVVYQLPKTRHSKSFCKVCGSALPSLQQQGQLVVVPAGSLESEIENKPNAHIFTASKASWDQALHTIPEFDTFPQA